MRERRSWCGLQRPAFTADAYAVEPVPGAPDVVVRFGEEDDAIGELWVLERVDLPLRAWGEPVLPGLMDQVGELRVMSRTVGVWVCDEGRRW